MKDIDWKWFALVVLTMLNVLSWGLIYYRGIDQPDPYSAHAELQSQALLDIQQELWDFEYNVERALGSNIGDMTDRLEMIDAEIAQLRREIRYYPTYCENELWLRYRTILEEYKDLEDRFHSMGEQYTYDDRMSRQEISRLEHMLDIAKQIYDYFREKGYIIYVDPSGEHWGIGNSTCGN